MVSNYTVTECHNADGFGGDMIWYNLEICDMTQEQVAAVLAVVKPFYNETRKVEHEEHLAWQEKQKKEE